MDSNSNTVVVTGFGPFRQYLVNSSWEAVKELSKRGLGENIDLRIMQLPVVYQKAKEQVCKIWTTLQPLLTVHVGLASSTTALIILEQCGKNKGYQERDACGFHPEGACCVLDGPEKIESTINMKTLWKNISVEGIDIILSRDAGRYICDYTYYTSLYYGNGRAAFIHVPPLSESEPPRANCSNLSHEGPKSSVSLDENAFDFNQTMAVLTPIKSGPTRCSQKEQRKTRAALLLVF